MDCPLSCQRFWNLGRSMLCLMLILGAAVTAARCRRAEPVIEPGVIRLIDVFKPEMVAGAAAEADPLPRTEWRFDGTAPPRATGVEATDGWQPGPGVAGLSVRDGRLVGRATDDFPVLHVERTSGFDHPDLIHAFEIRLRASAGANLWIAGTRGEKVDLVEMRNRGRAMPWRVRTPIVAGGELQTYTVTPPFHFTAADFRHVLIRPTDAPGATFEIESVRIVFRREHLASVASGIGWQGLKEIYRETLVSRSPERITFPLEMPQRPWLDLSLGTLEDRPVTFLVQVNGGDRAGAGRVLLERTLTTAHRWEPARLDLGEFAGRSVELVLSIAAEQPGTIGFWGSPSVRSALPAAQAAAGRAGKRPQGVIIIQADTLRRDHLDVHGYERETAPVLRRMAEEGVLFRDHVVQATWTKVSTPSLMTSLYPSTHGVLEFMDRLPAAAQTLAESYREAGHATVSYSSVLFTGQFTNLHQGFEELHEQGSVQDRESSKTAREFTDRLLEWIERHRDVPFFAFLHVFDPHDPYEPYSPYDTLWADPSKKEEHTRQTEEVRKVIADPLLKQFGMPTRDDLLKAGVDPDAYVAHDKDWYDGSIRAMDVEIGRLLERLRHLGLDEDTLVLFTSDHGEEFLEHGRTFHGQSVYGELTNVPLIMRWPGVLPQGRVIDETVQNIDIMPTLLDLSGLPHPEGLQGQSLMPLIVPEDEGRRQAGRGLGAVAAAEGWVPRPAISEKAPTQAADGSPPPRETESYAIVDGDWKLIHNRIRAEGAPEFELYDAGRDPLNLNDVASEHPDVVARLARLLEGWKQMADAARLKPDSEAGQGLSQEELQRLRSLGYIR
jgi:arylsulfatase A-like enzyme